MVEYSGPDLLADLSQRVEEKREELIHFFKAERERLPMPLYASVDIRDAGWKVAAVDANAYPAGFNNVGESQRGVISENLGKWLQRHHPNAKRLHIWPEAHTRNIAYVDNLLTLKSLFENIGADVTVGLRELNDVGRIRGESGELELSHVEIGESILVDGERPDLIILNNDLSDGPSEILSANAVAPPPEMGWYQRRKSNHFRHVQPFLDGVAEILGIDPWLIGTHWFVSEDKCLEKVACRVELAAQVDSCLAFLKGKYEQYGISGEPVLFVKNDSGTYGLGIIEIRSGEELLNLSNRKVNRLTYGKGGSQVADFLLQEGVPTTLRAEGYVVEPCTYGAGGESCATFYRVNDKKGEMSNLNTPSTQFFGPQKMMQLEGGPEILKKQSSWHALVAELAMLAMAAELEELQAS